MRDLEREGKVEVAIIETLILVDTLTEEIFEAFEVNGSMPSSQTIERILTLQLITQRRAKDLFREYHSYDHSVVHKLSTLDLTPVENEHSAAIDEAARWLASLEPHEIPRPIVPALQERFGLTAQQACEAIKEARR